MTTVIDNASVHKIAAWRREGHGIWHVLFMVEGYDDDFVMREPGKLSEQFVVKLAQKKLAKALGLSSRHVVHKETVKEP